MITDSVTGNTTATSNATPMFGDAAVRATPSPSVRQATREVEDNRNDAFDLKDVKAATQKVAGFVSSIRSELNFSVDEGSGINVVKVIDANTKEVIRQIPSREIIQLAQALDKVQGLLVRDSA